MTLYSANEMRDLIGVGSPSSLTAVQQFIENVNNKVAEDTAKIGDLIVSTARKGQSEIVLQLPADITEFNQAVNGGIRRNLLSKGYRIHMIVSTDDATTISISWLSPN